MSYHKDIIAALATPPGEGAIAVIRVSGDGALELANQIFTGAVLSFASHTAHYGKILQTNGKVIDHVLLLVMKNPKSYTGEDTVEISCHGGSFIAKKILERIYQAGARPANPGEFSFRAFINGKIDLVQAEAVQQVIQAKTDLSLKAASEQLEGALSKKISSFQKQLLDIAAIVEAGVDFPEEDLAFASVEELTLSLQHLIQEMEVLAKSFHEGKIIQHGISLCLIGPPNAGKSSLMNALLQKERAIVTPIAGTTRDLLEENISFNGLFFRIIDTAGIRATDEIIEQEGIKRSKKAMQQADIILLVLDASIPLDEKILELSKETLIVWNKIDLCAANYQPPLPGILISAEKEIGLQSLKQAIEEAVWKQGGFEKGEIVLTSARHFQALSNAITYCQKAAFDLHTGISFEFTVSDIRAALSELGVIIGMNISEEVLSTIFSKFCLGK